MNNILIAVSGTGGHVYPGIALAYELKNKGYNPIFVVNNNKNGVSLNIVKNSGYDYCVLDFKAPPRKISVEMLKFPFKFIKVLKDANSILNKFKPKIVVGMGAYLSFPVLFVASMKNIPTLIHEQNTVPGTANKVLSKFVNKIAVSFKETLKYFDNNKTVYTSNPIRKDIFNITRNDACKILNLNPDVFTVFVFGGSLGATKLNNMMFDVAKKLYEKYKDKFQMIHILGNSDYNLISQKYNDIKYKKYIAEYMNDIGNAYASCDMLICRAGAGTVKEVELYDLPAMFVPFPYATANHQYFNAKSIERSNRIVVEEKKLTQDNIINFIENNILKFKVNTSRKVSHTVFPQEILAQEVLKLINEKA